MPVATLASFGASAFNNSTSPKTASVTTQVGDLLVVGRVQGSAGASVNTTNPTGVSGATWSSRQAFPASANTQACRVNIHTAEGMSAATHTLSCVRPAGSTSNNWGFVWAVFRNHGGYNNGGGEALTSGTEAPAFNYTAVLDSCIFYICGDWNAVGGTQTGRTTGLGTLQVIGNYPGDGTSYGVWAGVWVGTPSAGVKSLGMTAPTGQRPAHAAVEILPGAGGGPAEVEGWGIAV
jgi:hypothetical protein